MNDEFKNKNNYDHLLKLNSFIKIIFNNPITEQILQEFSVIINNLES